MAAMGMDSGVDAGGGGLSNYDASSGGTADDELKNQQLNSLYGGTTWDASNPLASFGDLSGLTYQGPRSWMQGGGDSEGPTQVNDTGYFLSSNGTRLESSNGINFSDTYDSPGGNSQKVDVQYQYDPKTGTAKPISAKERYQGSDWVSQYRDPAIMLGSVLAAGAGGAYFGAGEAGAGGAAASTGAGEAVWNPALIDSYLGTTGYGASSASALAGAAPAYSAVDMGGGFGDEGTLQGGADSGGDLSAANGGSSADKAALYGNQGYGTSNPSLWQSVQTGATRGALTNGGITAARGGNGGDILKGAAYGAVGGAIGGGISNYNPAGEMGVTNPYAANAVNSGITGGVNAGLAGGNVGQGIVGGGINSGVNSAYNYAGDTIGNYFKPNTGGGMPDYGMPDTGTIGGNMYDENGESSATLGGDFTQAQQQANLGTNGYVPMQGGEAPQAPGMRAQSVGSTGGLGGFISGLTSNGGLGQMATGLNAAYMAYNARKRANGALDTINGLYAPDSPYAQQMQQSLARKDAAGGRNSQYGTRAVELAAALTNARSNALTSPGYQNMLMQQQKASQQLPITLASMAQSKWGQGAMTSAGDYLQRLYQNYNQPQPTAQTYSDWGPGE